MRNLGIVFAGIASFAFATEVNAFPIGVSTHNCTGVAEYNTAVINWSNRDIEHRRLAWDTSGTSSPVFEEVVLDFAGDTVSMERPIPEIVGAKGTTWKFTSLDPLHLDKTKLYNVRAYSTHDFLWVEVYRADVPVYPVYSTVFFVGAPDYLMKVSLDGEKDGVKCADLGEIKSDVQKNYADIYNPQSPGYIQYTKSGKAALMNRNFSYTD